MKLSFLHSPSGEIHPYAKEKTLTAPLKKSFSMLENDMHIEVLGSYLLLLVRWSFGSTIDIVIWTSGMWAKVCLRSIFSSYQIEVIIIPGYTKDF